VLLKLLTLFVVVPLVELALLLQLAEWTDWRITLGVVIITGVIGTLLARSQGFRTLRRIQAELRQGQLPAEALLDAAMIFFAGALLLTPGLITDVFGMSLLLPFCRRWYRKRLLHWIRRRFQVRTVDSPSERSKIIDSYIINPPRAEQPRDPSEEI
jgi:UPF0716 protein FxsA